MLDAASIRVGNVGLHRWVAFCSCGYEGPVEVKEADAEKRGQEHLAHTHGGSAAFARTRRGV